MFKKIIILAMLLMPLSFAASDEETFKTEFTFKMDTGIANITTEDGNQRTFNCNSNSSQTFNVNIRRNVSQDCDSRNLQLIRENVNSMMSSCNTLSSQTDDQNKYFTLYATCNAENQVCQTKLTDKDLKINELNTFKTMSDSCSVQLGDTQRFGQEITQRLQVSMDNSTRLKNVAVKESSQNIFYGIGGMVIVGALWMNDRRKMNPETNRGRTGGLR